MIVLANEQLERDKIKAAQAKADFEAFYATTLKAEDANLVLSKIDQLVALALTNLAFKMAQVIERETDETQIHFLLSDTVHDGLLGLGYEIKQKISNPELSKSFTRAIKPKDLLTVSQCAEKYRVIKTGTNMPGPWRNNHAPHIVEIMDSLSLHSPVKKVTFKKSSGVSGTEILLNWILYCVLHAEKDLLLVVPDQKLLDKTHNPRLRKMIRETPALLEVYKKRTQADKDSEDILEIGNVKIVKSIAKANQLRGEHLPYTATDEKSAMPLDIDGEGDVGMLTQNRRKAFSRSKGFDVSSPTQDGFCQISEDYLEGSQEERYIFCPHCNHGHTFAFKNFKWQTSPIDEKQVLKAWFVCPECKGEILESQKNDLLDKAAWIAKFPYRLKTHRSFSINSFYIKYGLGLTWKEIAELWLRAQGDSAKIITFVNTYLAEASTFEGERIEANTLLSRLETYPDTLPDVMRVFGADVQKDRIEVTFVDFEATAESWVQEHIILEGNPAEEDNAIWSELEQALKDRHVDFGCIDSGFLSQNVYAFCMGKKWITPIKGQSGWARPFTEDNKARLKKLRSRRIIGIKPEMIGVDSGKLLVHKRLQKDTVTTYDIDNSTGEILSTNRSENSGYIHFRNDGCFDNEYFEQLTAETLITKKRQGREYLEWQTTRARNEALDCMVYCAAAFEIAKTMKTVTYSQKPPITQHLPNPIIDNQNIKAPTLKKPRRTLKLQR